jgi:hypothetical protein
MFQDDLAQQRRGRPHGQGFAGDALEGPVLIAAMTGGHVFGHGGVLAVAGAAHVGGDPFPTEEHLDGPGRQPRLDGGAGVAIGDRVEVTGYLDVIVEADLAQAPLSKDIRVRRQGRQPGRVDLLEQLTAGAADIAQDPPVIEGDEQLGDGDVDVGQAVKSSVAQGVR